MEYFCRQYPVEFRWVCGTGLAAAAVKCFGGQCHNLMKESRSELSKGISDVLSSGYDLYYFDAINQRFNEAQAKPIMFCDDLLGNKVPDDPGARKSLPDGLSLGFR